MTKRQPRPHPPPKDPGNPSPQYGRKYPADHLTRDEVERILARLDAGGSGSARDRALVGLLWTSGARISEALALVPHDVNRERRTVRILRGKGGKTRTTVIGRRGVELLEVWLAERSAGWGVGPEAPLFCARHGGRMSTTYFRRVLARAAREAGVLKRVHPHILRHTFAVELVQLGVAPSHLQQLLGHEYLSITDRYLKSLSPEAALDAVRSLDW